LIGALSNDVTPKKFWNLCDSFGIHSKRTETSIEYAPDVINDHFAAIVNDGSDLDNSDIPTDTQREGESFAFTDSSQFGVLDAIEGISSDACGFDGISIKFLKLIIEYVIDPLTHLVNFSLSSGSFSKYWKKSVLTPIPKKSEVRSLDDLRPISILPCVSKIVERVVHNQLTRYLCSEDLLDNFQSGFRRNHSTTTALLKVSNDLREAINIGNVSFLLLLDFSKAFDKINHKRLIKKLRTFNLSESVVSWFVSYLEGRSQCVEVGGVFSRWLSVSSGVPQGSILGPLLFSLYINDISVNLRYCRHHLFADDCQIYFSFRPGDVEVGMRSINEDLVAVQRWARTNGLCLNASKT
jgi:hypothetical protein